MPDYFTLKLIHILSATLLFGTGLGTAFFMWMAHRRGNIAAIAVTARHVVLADWLFTAPAVVVQPISGWLLMRQLGVGLDQAWLRWVVILYLVTGACWLPVVAIQLRVRSLAETALRTGGGLGPDYRRLMRVWFWLGWPAFIAVATIFWLMTAKPALA